MKKRIIIAGSSSGIGKATTKMLLDKQHWVLGLARHHGKFICQDPNYETYTIDFSQVDTLEARLKPLAFAHREIDVLIASVGYGQFGALEEFSVQQMQNIMNVNFLSQAIFIKTFLPHMKRRKQGKIILIGSECAHEGQKKGTLYCASKFALRGFTQSLRKECASSQISVTLINPGPVDTPFFDTLAFKPANHPDHAICPDEVAKMIDLVICASSHSVLEEINCQPMKKVFEKNNPDR